jgi:hypothetical protein
MAYSQHRGRKVKSQQELGYMPEESDYMVEELGYMPEE